MRTAADLVGELGAEIGLRLPAVQVTGDDPVLPSDFRIGTAAAASIGAVTAAVALIMEERAREEARTEPLGGAGGFVGSGGRSVGSVGLSEGSGGVVGSGGGSVGPVVVGMREAVVTFRDERYLLVDGEATPMWAPLSGDYRAADGWVRLHCNFDHHRDAALRALGLALGSAREDVVAACARRAAADVEQAVIDEGGCAAAMRSPAEWRAHPQARAIAGTPLVRVARLDDGFPVGAIDDGSTPISISRANPQVTARAAVTLPDPCPRSEKGDGDANPHPAERDRDMRSRLGEGDRGQDPCSREQVGNLEPRSFEGGGSRGSCFRDGAQGRDLRSGVRLQGLGARPLAGVRVLDLTRVIAGPVAARVLAAYGAEVLRVGAAHLPEVPGAVIGTAFGKRSCEIDLRTAEGAAAFRGLVAGADVVMQAYRPGALAALGFGVAELAAIRPGIVCVDISAYGADGPWAGRRGFDSLVQMACGIAWEGGDGERPVPLPAQVLDHATGWLAALGALAGLLRRRAEGGSWHAELSLARTAQWLDGLGRVDGQGAADPDPSDFLAEMDGPDGRLTYVRPPGRIGDLSPFWSSPPPRRGEHPPTW
ncbi:hypothetical protein Ssi03_10840 [Sphaerisporangium siamense]|nr:hypothetical protein Ssi03_10840 [Sphaerisporangium siamense]